MDVAIVASLGALLGLALLYILYKRRRKRSKPRSGLSQPLLEPTDNDMTFEMVMRGPENEQEIKYAWQVDFAKLHLERPIGSGGYGLVFKGTYDGAQKPVAIKRLPLSIDEETKRIEIAAAQREMHILWNLRHPNLLHFFGVAFAKIHQQSFMLLVTELCTYSLDIYTGDTEKKAQAVAVGGLPPMSPAVLRKIVQDVASGLAFMHSKSVIQ